MAGKSRASAAALSTVLRTTTLSYGNMPFSGTCPPETPQPIKMKYSRLITSVGLRDVPKMIAIGWLEAAPQIGEIKPQKLFLYLTLLYLTLHHLFFLVMVYSKTG
jgi:hypothetical protein